MTATAEQQKAAARSAPVGLDQIKDDLGIPLADTTHDAWLQRRIDGIWSRFQSYTGRPLQLASAGADDWGTLVQNAPAATEPPLLRAWPSGSVFLRVFPVQSITKLTTGGTVQDATRVLFSKEDGKLVGLDGQPCDLRAALLSGRSRVEYMAGFEALPGDLYEALLGALQVQWSSRQSQTAGLGAGGLRRISAIDVGDVELGGNSAFVEGAMKGAGAVSDPLLGPFANLLDPYVDWRSLIGGAYASTTALP
jgi:hypothetical protein